MKATPWLAFHLVFVHLQIWNSLCNKKLLFPKIIPWFKHHPELNIQMRYILLEWLMEVSVILQSVWCSAVISFCNLICGCVFNVFIFTWCKMYIFCFKYWQNMKVNANYFPGCWWFVSGKRVVLPRGRLFGSILLPPSQCSKIKFSVDWCGSIIYCSKKWGTICVFFLLNGYLCLI